MALKTVIAPMVGVGVLMAGVAAMAQQPTPEQVRALMAEARQGAPTYQAVCDSCHGPPNPNTPSRAMLAAMTSDHIYETLTKGKMKMAGDTITDAQKRAVSIYLTGKPLTLPPVGDAPAPAPAAPAAEPAPAAEHEGH